MNTEEWNKLYDGIDDVANSILINCSPAFNADKDEKSLELMHELTVISMTLKNKSVELNDHLAWDLK